MKKSGSGKEFSGEGDSVIMSSEVNTGRKNNESEPVSI